MRNLLILLSAALLAVGCSNKEPGATEAANRPVPDAVRNSPVVPKGSEQTAAAEFDKLPADVKAKMGGTLTPPGGG